MANILTRLEDAGLPGFEKEWKACVLYARALGAHDMNIEVFNEKKKLLKTKALRLGEGEDYWDVGLWDVMLWDGGGVQRSVFSVEAWSERIQLRVSNNYADQPFEVLSLYMLYNNVKPLAVGIDEHLASIAALGG